MNHDSELEKTIAKLIENRSKGPGADPSLTSQVRTSLNAELNRRQASSGFPSTAIIIAAAALLLLSLSVAWYWQNSHRTEEAGGGQGLEVPMVSAKDKFYVLRTEPAKQSLLAQEFKDFTVKYSKVGSEIGGFILTGIEEDAFSLRREDGMIVRMEIGHWNKESLSALEKEVFSLRECHRSGVMTANDLNRLGSIARYGDLTAVRVLKQIAARGGGHYQKEAKEMLAGANPEALAGLIILAKDQAHPYRKNVLQTLANLKTIQGAIVLREIAACGNDPCQLAAIKTLADCNDKESLPVLEKLCQDPAVPLKIRQAAREAFKKLTQKDREIEKSGD
ncbi:HEAT repeat domain-containing protein [Planctomycetota bacterium]